MTRTFDQIVDRLGFRTSEAWVEASRFDAICGPVGALRQARDTMGVQGAFGTWQTGTGTEKRRFVPLLYIATATDAQSARLDVHRKVWSQGLVPLLIICTPETVFLSEGFDFAFTESDWLSKISVIPSEELTLGNSFGPKLTSLDQFNATRLLSSLSWKDFSINPSARVDQRLLSTLGALSARLVRQSNVTARAANALIGRFLYFYILRDRGLISNEWLQQFQATSCFEDRGAKLTTTLVWSVFDALDKVLNGTIFPLNKAERQGFSDADVQLLRDCIKLGDDLQADGIQLSFFEFALSSLQTETLSAIYEQFLESEDSDGKRLQGVFYTPPFLVDFVLDRLEDEIPLTSELRVIDCTAGSGVFVVGAFRRIIEHELATKRRSALSASKLRELLLNSIFAIEKSHSAHSVTAFSLYVTMLEYVEQEDIYSCLAGKASETLFPPLAKTNVICSDVFDIQTTDVRAHKFDVVIGNPPWQQIQEITRHADRLEVIQGDRVDSKEAAEHTLWWAAHNLLKQGGIAALVLPTKSLVGPSASKFPTSLARDIELIGVVNLSHLRYTLFSHARQAACAVLLRNRPPSSSTKVWSYSPTRAQLPAAVNDDPWLITLDRAQVQTVIQRDLQRSEESWFELLMLRPVDRHIKRFISDSTAVGRLLPLNQLLKTLGLELRKGGSPSQTGLDPVFLHGADKNKANDIRIAPGVKTIGRGFQFSLLPDGEEVALDPAVIGDIAPNFLRRFSGDVLLVPRSMTNLAYSWRPVAFNSSINAIFFTAPTSNAAVRSLRQRFLFALGVFFESSIANYLYALYGRLWILDRTRLEKNDLLTLPVPFQGLDDPFIETFLAADDQGRTKLFCERAELVDWSAQAAIEYTEFRHEFEDGGTPTTLNSTPTADEIALYSQALDFSVRPICLEDGPEIWTEVPKASSNKYNLYISLSKHSGSQPVDQLEPSDVNIKMPGVAEFSDSLQITYSAPIARLSKPAGRQHWTIEAAFADGATVMQQLMQTSRG